MKLEGSKNPYNEEDISKIPCKRCGMPSYHQWQVCSNDNRYLGVCKACDVELNRIVLKFFRFDDLEYMIQKYAKNMVEEDKK